jgi:hypothetical protein
MSVPARSGQGGDLHRGKRRAAVTSQYLGGLPPKATAVHPLSGEPTTDQAEAP